MRNQTSFRLTTTLLPSDTTAKTTQVINKVDSNGNKFYPTFTEETVVLTNDDRTVMETARATCDEWVLTFTVRWLPDDWWLEPVPNRKLTWNPWTLIFITAGASDWIDKDDDITWTGKQTYTGDMESRWKATYKWELITEKWVKYPHFDNVAALEAYSGAFGGMFAVVDSTGELYRYNAVTQEWSVVESSTPTNPEMADTTTIWTVRVATDTEFNNWTATGSHGEYLVATPSQIQSVSPEVDVDVFELNETTDLVWWQAVLDALLAWKSPVIRVKHEVSWNYKYRYYYLISYNDWSGYFDFIHITLDHWSDSSWAFVTQEKLRLNYSWTTITSISVYDYIKFYVTRVAE